MFTLGGMRQKMQEFRTMVTVEPCMAIFLIAMSVTTIANQNLLLDKTCRVNLQYSDEMCDALIRRDLANATAKEVDTEVQKYVTRLTSVGKLAQVAIPFVLVLFWGTWSDRHHLRKPLIIVPMLGEVLKNICLIVCVFFEKSNAEVAFFVENIFPLAFGNWIIIVMGVFSHIMDTTTIENRTMKVAFNNVFVTLGDPIGSALSGVLLREIGYYGIFTLSAVLMFVGVVFCVFGVEEGPKQAPHPTALPEIQEGKDKPVERLGSRQKEVNLFCDFFNCKDLCEILKVFTRKRTENKRLMLFLCYGLLFFGFGPVFGSYSVNYLFSRHQFNYSEIEYSIFGTVTSIAGTAALIVIMFLNTKLFKLNDYGLAMVGLCFGIVSSIAFGLSKVSLDFYIAGAIDSGNSVFGVSLRAALMKLVDADEAAKSNAIIGAVEASILFLFSVVYNLIYNLTMDTYAGAFYFVTTACSSIALVITVVLYRIYKSTEKRKLASQVTLESAVLDKY